jgi:thiol-disulfide isomerase/thioredoxin
MSAGSGACALTADNDVAASLHEAEDFRQRGQLTSAMDSARKALKQAKGSCEECQRRIVDLFLEMDRPHDAVEAAASWASHAANPTERAAAEYIEARALLLEDRAKHNESLLKRADQVLTKAVVDNPGDPGIHLLQGRVLVALKKDADAKAQFEACLNSPGATPLQCRRAGAYAQNLTLTANEEAPEFHLTGPDGNPVSPETLAGKVVLIDFWATWCAPCATDLGYVQSIEAEFADKNFILVGVSSDDSEAAWKRYVAENRMKGVQVRDNRRAMKDLFHVSGIPTYIILDANGLVRFRTTGALKDLRTKVRELIAEPGGAKPEVAHTAGN